MEKKQIQQLKDEIVKAVPEIMELKFGCEIFFQGLTQKRTGIYLIMGKEIEKFFAIKKDNYDENGLFSKKTIDNDCKIIGRPIRLADVLLAIKRDRPTKSNYIQYVVCEDGRFFAKDNGEKWIWLSRLNWNLKDNNLDNQTNLTKQFLIDLLVE